MKNREKGAYTQSIQHLICSHFLSWNSTLFHINAILPPILCITRMFVFKTRIASLTQFNLLR